MTLRWRGGRLCRVVYAYRHKQQDQLENKYPWLSGLLDAVNWSSARSRLGSGFRIKRVLLSEEEYQDQLSDMILRRRIAERAFSERVI
jgi:hypothetical protein